MAASALSTDLRRLAGRLPIGALAALAAACSGPADRFGAPAIDPVTTASFAEKSETSISPIDLASMREAISGSLSVPTGGTVFCSNRKSGSDGIIEFAVDDTADSCRPFSATVSDLRGIRRYRSEACPGSDGGWDFAEITPEDSVLL